MLGGGGGECDTPHCLAHGARDIVAGQMDAPWSLVKPFYDLKI